MAGVCWSAAATMLPLGIVLAALPLSGSAQAQTLPPDLTAGPLDGAPYAIASEPMAPADTLAYEPGQPVPEGYRIESGYHSGLLASGGVLFALSYALSLVAARVTDARGEQASDDDAPTLVPLYAPLVGPFIALGSGSRPAADAALLIVDGIGQGAGFALAMVGLTTRAQWLSPEGGDHGLRVSLAPTAAQLSVAF